MPAADLISGRVGAPTFFAIANYHFETMFLDYVSASHGNAGSSQETSKAGTTDAVNACFSILKLRTV